MTKVPRPEATPSHAELARTGDSKCTDGVMIVQRLSRFRERGPVALLLAASIEDDGYTPELLAPQPARRVGHGQAWTSWWRPC